MDHKGALMISLENVNPDLRARIERMLLLSNYMLWVKSAWRSRKEQEGLYALYLAGGTLAAKPGTSNHERGLAVDVACNWEQNELRKSLAKQLGLITPVKGEPWHMELDPKRKPLPPLEIPVLAKSARIVAPVMFNATILPENEDTVIRKEVHIPSLDDKGNGWIDSDIAFDRFINCVICGPAPDRDTYDWANIYWSTNNTNGKARIEFEGGKPNQPLDVVLWGWGE